MEGKNQDIKNEKEKEIIEKIKEAIKEVEEEIKRRSVKIRVDNGYIVIFSEYYDSIYYAGRIDDNAVDTIFESEDLGIWKKYIELLEEKLKNMNIKYKIETEEVGGQSGSIRCRDKIINIKFMIDEKFEEIGKDNNIFVYKEKYEILGFEYSITYIRFENYDKFELIGDDYDDVKKILELAEKHQ